MNNIFVRAWQGKASLAAAFWLVYFVFGIILSLIIVICFSLFKPDFTFIGYSDIIVVIESPYILYAAICVWRCGKNSTALWRILSRIVIVIALLSVVLHIWNLIHPPVDTTATTTPAPAEPTA